MRAGGTFQTAAAGCACNNTSSAGQLPPAAEAACNWCAPRAALRSLEPGRPCRYSSGCRRRRRCPQDDEDAQPAAAAADWPAAARVWVAHLVPEPVCAHPAAEPAHGCAGSRAGWQAGQQQPPSSPAYAAGRAGRAPCRCMPLRWVHAAAVAAAGPPTCRSADGGLLAVCPQAQSPRRGMWRAHSRACPCWPCTSTTSRGTCRSRSCGRSWESCERARGAGGFWAGTVQLWHSSLQSLQHRCWRAACRRPWWAASRRCACVLA